MTESRHKWFQIHLSTALALMFAAGWLLYVNMTVQYIVDTPGSTDGDGIWRTGWPAIVYQRESGLTLNPGWHLSLEGALINIGVGIIFLTILALSLEFDLSRRLTRKIDERRHWVRIHISTATLMMFVAGGVLWLNFVAFPNREFPIDLFKLGFYNTYNVKSLGWPYCCACTFGKQPFELNQYQAFINSHIVIDCCVGIFSVLFAGAAWEYYVRYCEALRPSQQVQMT